jgi:hypothetical protein
MQLSSDKQPFVAQVFSESLSGLYKINVSAAAWRNSNMKRMVRVMAIEDQLTFPKFNTVSTGLRQAEDNLLDALKRRDKSEIAAAKIALMAALDAYGKAVDSVGEDLPWTE